MERVNQQPAEAVPRHSISSSYSSSPRESGTEWPGSFAPIRTGDDVRAHDGDSESRDTDEATFRNRGSIAIIEEEDRNELRRLATVLSTHRRQSTATIAEAQSQDTRLSAFASAAAEPDDPALDPASKSFDLSKWIQGQIKGMEETGLELRESSIAIKDLNVSGTGDAMLLQSTVGSYLRAPLHLGEHLSFKKKEHKPILHHFDGLVKSGELLIVLGRPGSGCSTLLKTVTGELHGLHVGDKSTITYNGIPQKKMIKEFKGETVYNQEVDRHFPHLTVGQTLEFAAAARTPKVRSGHMSRNEFISHRAKIAMAVCGLTHTFNTKVGNDFIRGVSGGERKRVSIAEMMLAGSPVAAWDNSTRGLDSATALKFVQALRLSSDFAGTVNAVAIYQASQAIYDLFDKAVVLYEGRQIYFGSARAAKSYFQRMGWYCPTRQTTGDFLTSVTNPQERQARDGMEQKVPRTPAEFEAYWFASPEYRTLLSEIEEHQQEFPIDTHGEAITHLREQKNARQAKRVRPKSPYIISTGMQIRLTTKRAYQRIRGDITSTVAQAAVQLIMALIIGSVFHNTPHTTDGLFAKGSVLFQGVLLGALTAIGEIGKLYAQRPIVEKHASYAFYHPATEAIAGIVSDIPLKLLNSTIFNIVLYFLAGLRMDAGAFFIYFLVTYITTFVMSAIFRTLAAITKTVSQAMMLAGVMVLALVIYTGFVIRVPQMHPWFGWIRWINPIYYAFEMLIANEFHGQRFACADTEIVPVYGPETGDSNAWICSTVGSVAGELTVSGDAFIETNYEYYNSHMWRNFGILMGFLIFFMAVYFVATEMNSTTSSEAEVLVFRRGRVPGALQKNGTEKDAAVLEDMTTATSPGSGDDGPNGKAVPIEPQKDIFTWRDVVYDVPVKEGTRRLLDHVTGWVKPGTLTALMGVSGAGKTTLLDVLAQRTNVGVITGDMLVNGKPLDPSFQRSTGYVQQQDLHLQTATVRESLRFSATLRQPSTVPQAEKDAFVEQVIDMLAMRDFADAVVGIPGTGLNVEQRKLLTIGVELAARPKLLLFLDEPTSGLDSQSSWAICSFLNKLAASGQAVLCTVHQPSAVLFEQFDRLLFLAAGGKTVYFGDIGDNSRTLLDYFERNGGAKCGDEENPAEYMIEIVNQGKNDKGDDWHSVWNGSAERQGVMEELERIHAEKASEPVAGDGEARGNAEFATPFTTQLVAVTARVFQQYWRVPSYIFAKFILGVASGIFIGFSFYNADATLAGMQDVLFAVFMVITIFSTIVHQIHPHFLTQRDLYEVRERPSKAYSWQAFMFANVVVEIPYQVITGILIWACFYYPVMGVQSSERQVLVLLFCIQLLLYASSFAQMTIAALHDEQTASSMVTLLVLMSLTFCGVLQSPDDLPGFWIFMYRLSPFTYWVGGIVSTQLHDREVQCSSEETAIFDPPGGQSCASYLQRYLEQAPGVLQNPDATSECRYCPLTVADQYMAGAKIYWSERWRNFGIMWAFILFNIAIAVFTYWAFRVKKWNFRNKKK